MVFNTTVLTIPVESNLANALNFLIFDVVLISLVFHLTSDVSGRLNDADLSAGEPRVLFFTSPPVIGGGLCTTRPFRASLLLFARILGLLLILVTNLTIGGKSEAVLRTQRAEVVVPGSLENFTVEDTEISMLRRSGCLGSASTNFSTDGVIENITFYGEIRNDECEVDKELVFPKAVKFSQRLVKYNISTGNCVRNEERERNNIRVALFYCDTARIGCLFDYFRPERPLLRTCRGVIWSNGLTYIADEGTVWPEMPREEAEARLVSGIDWRDDQWFDSIFTMPSVSMEDNLHATYGAFLENRTVTVRKELPRTDISAFWFAALALKLLIVAILGVTSFSLWKQGFETVAHDERRIAQILRRRIEQNDPRLTVRNDFMPNIYLNAGRRDNGRLHVFASGRRTRQIEPGTSGNVVEDANYQRHLEEAEHY